MLWSLSFFLVAAVVSVVFGGLVAAAFSVVAGLEGISPLVFCAVTAGVFGRALACWLGEVL